MPLLSQFSSFFFAQITNFKEKIKQKIRPPITRKESAEFSEVNTLKEVSEIIFKKQKKLKGSTVNSQNLKTNAHRNLLYNLARIPLPSNRKKSFINDKRRKSISEIAKNSNGCQIFSNKRVFIPIIVNFKGIKGVLFWIDNIKEIFPKNKPNIAVKDSNPVP